MLNLPDTPGDPFDRGRRRLLQIGSVGALGLALPQLLARDAAGAPTSDSSFGRAKNFIYLFLSGGPSQYETFDPKPDAPTDVRGEFQPISTDVPGIQICELLPRTARIADKLAICRSLATDDPQHESGGYWVNTGRKYVGPDMRALAATDWPTLGSIVKRLKPSERVPFTTVQLPEPIIANPGIFLPGQNAGFLGREWDPEIFRCDPSVDGFRVTGYDLPAGITGARLESRRSLLDSLDHSFEQIARSAAGAGLNRLKRDAFDVLLSGAVKRAFDMHEEPTELRDRYGRGKWGQSVLLARRLIEAGVRMVFVNWPREPGDLSANNPLWDTHARNNPRMKDVLCPQFDLGFTALIEDLDQRGMLDETLVVAVGEMGRTPKFNAAGGRDHWGNVFPFVMAGAGVKTAQVLGASDKTGAYPARRRVTPDDLAATIYHLLGISHDAFFPDRAGRPLRVTEGRPIGELLGTGPATTERTVAGGIIPLLAKSANDPLENCGFEDTTAIRPFTPGAKGWQADPLWSAERGDEFSVILARVPDVRSRGGQCHAALGYGLATGHGKGEVAQGARAVLLQEIRNPQPGNYTVRVHASGGAYDRPDYYRDVWCRHFTCRLVLFGFTDEQRDPRRIVEYAATKFTPEFAGAHAAAYRPYSVTARLESQNNNANQLSHGIGVAIIVEKTTPGVLVVADGGPLSQGLIRIDDVELQFEP
jgi:hypothetical protein